MASNGLLVLEKLRDVEDGIKEKIRTLEDRIKALEGSQRVLKILLVYNAITNTAIVLLLWHVATLLASAHGGGAASAAVASHAAQQQIAVIGK